MITHGVSLKLNAHFVSAVSDNCTKYLIVADKCYTISLPWAVCKVWVAIDAKWGGQKSLEGQGEGKIAASEVLYWNTITFNVHTQS